MIPIFERLYPNAVGKFIFDQSSAHGAFAKDALNSKEMNVNPGGKQCPLHSMLIPQDNPDLAKHGKPQSMIVPEDLLKYDPNYQYHGQPKGMHIFLEEQGLISLFKEANGGKIVGECKFFKSSHETKEKLMCEAQAAAAGGEEPDGMVEDALQASILNTCCMRKALESQQDFKSEKPLLQIVLEDAGHKCYFLPKFHCELNPIETYWGWTKIRKLITCFLQATTNALQVFILPVMEPFQQQSVLCRKFLILAPQQLSMHSFARHGGIWMLTTSSVLFFFILYVK